MSTMNTATTPTTAKKPARPSRAALRPRERDLARIHTLAKQLQLDDSAYRDLMATVCGGVRSAALLDISGRMRFIEHLERCVRAGSRPAAAAPGGQQREIARQLNPREKLLWALWMKLADAGLVQHRTMQALSAYAQRQTGVAHIRWCNEAQLDLVADSLKQWLKRENLDASTPKRGKP
jgi:hypothetical protein